MGREGSVRPKVMRAITLARSDHPIAMGGSEPSATAPRTPPPGIVWCCETPVLENPDERSDERDKNVSWDRVSRGPSSTKGRIKAESERSQQARGVPGVEPYQTVERGSVTNRHDSPCHIIFGGFGGPFSRQDVHPEKKRHWESGLTQRDEANPGVWPKQNSLFPEQRNLDRGCFISTGSQQEKKLLAGLLCLCFLEKNQKRTEVYVFLAFKQLYQNFRQAQANAALTRDQSH